MRRSIIVVTAVALIAVLAVSGSAMAARPPNVPPATPGVGIVMESGSDYIELEYSTTNYLGQVIYNGEHEFAYDEVRHISVSAVTIGTHANRIYRGSTVRVGFQMPDGEIIYRPINHDPEHIVDYADAYKSQLALQFDAQCWKILAYAVYTDTLFEDDPLPLVLYNYTTLYSPSEE